MAHTGSVPIGGAHFTNDLAVGLRMPLAQAEEIKRQYGHAVVTAVPQTAEIEIANPEPQMLRLRTVAEILEPRARELLYFVKEALRQGGAFEALGAGCVLTGGGAMLPGMLDVTESSCVCRRGRECRCGFRTCRASLRTRLTRRRLECCYTRIARGLRGRRRTTDCAPGCGRSLLQITRAANYQDWNHRMKEAERVWNRRGTKLRAR